MARVGAIEFGGISVAKLNLMAYDLGASSGRAMLGEFDGKKIEMQVKEGDRVLYSKYAGTEISFGEKKYVVVRQTDILAVVK